MNKLSSKTVGRVVLVIVAISFGWAAFELARRLEREPIHVHWGWLAVSSLALAMGYTSSAFAFSRILRQESGRSQRFLSVCELYFRGILARYLPGKVGIPAVRMSAAVEFGVGVPFMAGSVIMETLASIATAGAVAAFITVGPWAAPALRAVLSGPWTLPLLIAICGAVAALAIIDVRRYPGFVVRILRMADRTGPLLHLYWIAGCTAYWLATAVSSGLCAYALSEPVDIALLAGAAGVLGPIVAFFALVAPGGLGVREAFVVVLLSPQIGATRALAFSLVSRAVTLATELAVWLLARGLLALRSR
ncbi:MAG: hypothetical protein QM778_11695 [Myxococcales bacterium]